MENEKADLAENQKKSTDEEIGLIDNLIAELDDEPKEPPSKRHPAAGQTREWEQPVSFNNIAVPPFPIDCLSEAVKNYVLAVSEATQTPVDMAAVAALTVLAACTQGKYKVQGNPNWIEPVNLYSVIVMNPAERKSAVLGYLTKYINEYEYKENEKNKCEINRSRTEKGLLIREIDNLMNAVAKGKGDKNSLLMKQDELTNFKEVKPLRLLADDATPEALTTLLESNDGKISVISSEGGIFEMLQGRYTQGINIDTFLKAHCGDPIRVDRKGRASEYIKEPCLTVLLTIQPKVLDGLMDNDIFRGKGLTARFLYSMPVSHMGHRKAITEAIPLEYCEQYRETCFRLLDMGEECKAQILTLSSEAYSLSVDFAERLEPRLIDDLEEMADFAGKLHGTVLRIAGILHVAGRLAFSDTPISVETMRDAVRIGFYFLEHARAAYQLMGADEQIRGAKYVLDKIKKQGLEKFTKNDLMRICRKCRHVEELDEPLGILTQFGYLSEPLRIQASNNKMTETYHVNPLIYK